MEREELFRKISIGNEKKMVLLVLDGLGGLPFDGKTELETARTPNLDLLAAESELGLSHPIAPGITPGSGPAHLSLFGYDPLKYEIGRGILEALGVGIEVGAKSVAGRGNFATLENGLITDRRAGRISTEKNREIIAYLREKIKRVDDVEVGLYSGEEHRFVLVLTGEALSDQLTDADPEATGRPVLYTRAKGKAAAKTARIINNFIDRLTAELTDFYPANTCLLRGFAKYPAIPSLGELFKLKAAAIAVYPMYKGLAQLVGMDILETGRTIQEQISALKKHYSEYDFFFVHVKKTDSYGEDGNFAGKVSVIEEFDRWLPEILELTPDVLVVSGDHSTPALLKAHSWHPNPVLLKASFQRQTLKPGVKFSEKNCASGILGTFYAMDVLPLMMANALKFKKYGA
ncbi:MAG: 2,3-bisphosphoglycerate-independent phosphoglycerate mutase [Chrysiogenia bacterium]